MQGILFFDIDGTLVDSRHHQTLPSLKTIQAIQQARKQGYLCLIASGRNYVELTEYLNLGMDGCVFSDGAGIMIHGHDLVISPIEQPYIDTFLKEVVETGLASVKMATLEGSFMTADQYEFFWKIMKRREAEHPEFPAERVIRDMNFQLLENYHREQVLQIDVYFKNQDVERQWVNQHQHELHYISTGDADPDTGICRGEITARGITKATGCRHVMSLLGSNACRTYAFGDSMNDAEMLRVCDVGIAMGNAVEELKQIADYVTDAIEDEGLSKAMVHFGLGI